MKERKNEINKERTNEKKKGKTKEGKNEGRKERRKEKRKEQRKKGNKRKKGGREKCSSNVQDGLPQCLSGCIGQGRRPGVNIIKLFCH
jgi:hypothetical protein